MVDQGSGAGGRRTPLGASYRKVFGASVVSNLGDGVGAIAYPWLAAAVTRNAFLVALVAVCSRLPWLVFSLPAGVITDRVDRRRAMVAMDVCRCLVTTLVALAVLARHDALPAPDALDAVVQTDWVLYGALLVATLALGMAEVLRDNAAQTILPAIVPPEQLERANGRMWSAEGVANTFVGPPLGSVLLAVSFVLPFVVDAASFAVAAALVALVPGTFRAGRAAGVDAAPDRSTTWRHELVEGVRWLWEHELLRPMAITLGIMNAASMVTGAVFVLFAQEVLEIGPTLFAVVGMGGAIGGIIGGGIAAGLSRRLGSGACLAVTLAGSALINIAMALTSWWPVAFVLFTLTTLVGILWNVITVSLRQTIIPDHLLGRVNSVYRFFAWGMMPIGAAIGGLVVVAVDAVASRDLALRATWIVSGAVHVLLWLATRRTLSTARIEAARAAAHGGRGTVDT
jgi:MFS family permease